MKLVRWTRWSIVTLCALALLLLVAAGLYLWRASPQTAGQWVMAAAQGEIRIERDAHGIPTIRANSLDDAFFGLGVVHAQDRLWQLETHRRIGAGRLAEAFGEGALQTDRFIRALGVRHAAQAQWERTPEASRAALQAYARGINATVQASAQALPPEFLILGVRPEAWTPVDSLAWALMMAWDLGGNWNAELMRMRLALQFPLQRVQELMPAYPGDAPVATRDYSVLYRELGLAESVRRTAWLDLPQFAPTSGVEGVGSNNWVLSGAKTNTGAALLANDPHLKLSAPALWYFARIEVPGLKAAGATMPGVPSIVLGQNEHIAWGFTNTGPDVQDLYIERLKPDDPTQVQTPQGWQPMAVREERIAVKGGAGLDIKVRSTRHGPVISDAGAGAEWLRGPDAGAAPRHVLAMRWTALDPDADPVGAGLAMLRAASVQEFIEASALWVAPMQNMVVADRKGRIGFVAAGRVPLRHPDNDLRGLAPAPGWEARYDWQGWLPADATPREIDPPRGWIATANQRIHGPDYPHHLTHDWTAPWRQQRIEALIQARERHSMEDLARMQSDRTSLAAQALMPMLLGAAQRSTHALAPAAREQLQGWSGQMQAQLAAPLIHWAWIRQFTRALLADEFGGDEAFAKAFPARSFRDAVEAMAQRSDAWWCDDKSTAPVETCEQTAQRALDLALQELGERFGTDASAWQWGRAHQAVSEHRPFSRVKALSAAFVLRAPVGGDTYTVDATRVVLKADAAHGDLYHSDHGPSLRALYDLGNASRSRVMHSSGQSGLPWSALYRSFVTPWAAGAYVPLWPPPDQAAVGGSLLIRPPRADGS